MYVTGQGRGLKYLNNIRLPMRNATRKRHRPGLPYNEPPTAGAELSSSAVVLEHCRRVPATTLPHTRPEVPGCDFRSKHIPKVKRLVEAVRVTFTSVL